MGAKEDLEVFKAEMNIKKTSNVKELGLAFKKYLDARVEANQGFPKLSELQRKHWREIKRLTGQTGIMQVLIELLDEDPLFPVMPRKIQGKGPYYLMPNTLKEEREYAESQKNSDQTKCVKSSQPVKKLDTTQSDEMTQFLDKHLENVQDFDDSIWDRIK